MIRCIKLDDHDILIPRVAEITNLILRWILLVQLAAHAEADVTSYTPCFRAVTGVVALRIRARLDTAWHGHRHPMITAIR